MPLLKEIMTPSVEVIAPNATAADAARKMRDLDVGAIPVCDGEKLLGMVTDRDLVLRVLALSRSPVDALVSDAMTPGLVYCFEDQDAVRALGIDPDVYHLNEGHAGFLTLERIRVAMAEQHMSFEEAVKLLLVSFDSTLKANLSVGLPIDVQIYRKDSFRLGPQKRIERTDPYYQTISSGWGDALKKAFQSLPSFEF